jgi:glutamate synthase domain-containing protein 2/NAD-dependent dihydropyrimidine dehydrogenase PreA subunit
MEIKWTPSRFRNLISKYILKRGSACIKCGICVKTCQFGVHKIYSAGPSRPKDALCIGDACLDKCIDKCPEDALTMKLNPAFESLGDFRWAPDLILSTWYQAETGKIPPGHLEYKTGASGGGFDKLELVFPKEIDEIPEEEITTTIPLNRRDEERYKVEIDVPWYGGGMSFGSTALNVMIARAKASKTANTFTSTGEGGYPDALIPYDDHIITQIATGLFGVREETIQRVRIVEFKYAQGAKPGLGGHLLGEKVTPEVAKMREAVVGSSLFSPFPFHSVYSIEDHKKHVDWIKEINPKGLVSVKVSTPTDVDMVAIGSYYAGAHIVHLDGSYGGTGAAPNIAKKNIAMPIEYAIPKVHKFLCEEGVRDKITLIASGGIRSAYDVAKAIALGADGCVIGTAELIALECVKCGNCESGRGCVRGIATTDPELSKMIDTGWATQRLINLYSSWRTQLVGILKRLGMRSIKELVGRRDCLRHLDYQ